MNQTLALRMLEKWGHEVVIAGNGKEAIEALEKERFDLVLMDVQMPEMSGFEATAALRERERTTGGHVPIVAMTAHAMKGDRERCLEAGMDGYVSKPMQAKELLEAIDRFAPGVRERDEGRGMRDEAGASGLSSSLIPRPSSLRSAASTQASSIRLSAEVRGNSPNTRTRKASLAAPHSRRRASTQAGVTSQGAGRGRRSGVRAFRPSGSAGSTASPPLSTPDA